MYKLVITVDLMPGRNVFQLLQNIEIYIRYFCVHWQMNLLFQLPIGGESKRCNFKCRGDDNFFCGGYAAGIVSIYETGIG